MLKKVFICTIVLSCLIGLMYYYDRYIDKEPTIVNDVETKITTSAASSISQPISITHGRGRKLQLQLYNVNKKQWETKRNYPLKNQENEKINITYPQQWKKYNKSQWRMIINEGDTVEKYQSPTITIHTTNRKKLPLIAKSAIIMNTKTNQIYYQKAIHKKRSIASTTKIATCLVALENTQLTDKVRVTSEAVTTHLTRLRGVGDQIQMKDLLYMAMVCSDNGSATAIGQHTGGNLKNFSKMMNKRVEDIGCQNTHFTNPQGFTAKNHYSTAYDLALITKEAYQNKQLRSIVKTKSYSFNTLKKNNHYEAKTTNKLLGHISGVTGMKTGTTYKAGKCFVCTYCHKNETYVIVVLGSSEKGRWSDTKKLIKYINTYC